MIERAKTAIALLAGALAGYVVGVTTVASSVPKMNVLGDEVPAWFAAAEQQSMIAGVGALACVLAWVYIDYRCVVKE